MEAIGSGAMFGQKFCAGYVNSLVDCWVPLKLKFPLKFKFSVFGINKIMELNFFPLWSLIPIGNGLSCISIFSLSISISNQIEFIDLKLPSGNTGITSVDAEIIESNASHNDEGYIV